MELFTLTPVHIGNGQEIQRSEFVVDDKVIKFYDIDEIVRYILDNYNADSFKSFVEDKDNFSLEELVEHFKIDLTKFRLLKHYHVDDTLNTNKILEFINMNNRCYLPGTTIKGAIRTAVIYHLIKNHKLDQLILSIKSFLVKMQKIMQDLKQIHKNNREFSKELRKVISNNFNNFSFIENSTHFYYYNDAKYDIFKFLHIPDSEYINNNELTIKKIKIKNIGQPRTVYAECLKKDTKITFPGDIFIDKKSLDFSFDTISKELKDRRLLDTLSEIFESSKSILQYTNDFYQELLDFEKEHYNHSINILNKGYLIRIGRFKGFFANTIAMLIEKEDKELFGRFFKLVAPKGYEDNPAKSLKLVGNSNDTMGWCSFVLDKSFDMSKSKNGKSEKKSKEIKSNDTQNEVTEEMLLKLQKKFKGK
ncbi:type III-A CRISPR-associated RAMP protein Csm5 [Deferribacter thermophilus]|uniref:type III-A CRISPR-associated RAMP protein Csm5 n=1 Tax=Deferribacter thermophilus TaxID=53573 RepID=UPI003C133E2E